MERAEEVTDSQTYETIEPPDILKTNILHREEAVSILSYNILLPNSVDGWWVYKMYSPRHGMKPEETRWELRKGLLRNEIATANCDIVCLQEVSACSFDSDFEFMKELGYDMAEIYKKGRFRPATFWKSDRVKLASPPIHRDRILITKFYKTNDLKAGNSTSSLEGGSQSLIDFPLYLANCHLQAGDYAADRRLRSIHDCLDVIRKDASKYIEDYKNLIGKQLSSLRKARKKKSSSHACSGVEDKEDDILRLQSAHDVNINEILARVPVVVIGDMNCPPTDESAPHALLKYAAATVDGGKVVDSSITKKLKTQGLGIFVDAYEFAHRAGVKVPPTMVYEELYGVITDPASINDRGDISHNLSALALDCLWQAFCLFATQDVKLEKSHESEKAMCKADILRWLETINLSSNRGFEMRAALDCLIVPSRTDISQNNESVLESIEAMQNIGSGDCFPDDGYLNWSGFREVYQRSANQGTIWSVSWDLAACGFPIDLNSNKVYTARYDRAYVSLGWMKNCDHCTKALVAVSELPQSEVITCLPNRNHPSDHLPISILINI